MSRDFDNVYADERRADAYAELEFPGTYWLAFRDLPELLARHAPGGAALDFGCGAGRSTRFLRELGYRVVGVDVSKPMLERAREADPGGEYLRIGDGDFAPLGGRRFDLVFSSFTFDNVPGREHRIRLFRRLASLLAGDGRMVHVVSSEEIYVHEWTSFSTEAFPENRSAGPGDTVRIVMLDVDDRRPVEDAYWTDRDYRDAFARAGLELLDAHRPLGRPTDPHEWVTETRVSPWAIYVLGPGRGESP